MDDANPPPQLHPLDIPERRAKVVRTLLVLTPFLFCFCYVIAYLQSHQAGISVFIAFVAAGLCLATAGAIRLLGSKAFWLLPLLKVALLMAKR